jgi:hypothetical protein
MKYITLGNTRSKDATDQSTPWFITLLKLLLPRANPDFDRKYDQVVEWWIEVDELGEPRREIGFDRNGEPVVIGPIGRNSGVVTDSGAVFTEDEFGKSVDRWEFERLWTRLASDYRDDEK